MRAFLDVHRLGDTIVWVHPATGELLLERGPRTRTSGEGLMHWLYPLHSGTAFGMPGRVAMCLPGIAPIVLVGTGLWVWMRKRRAERFEEERRIRLGTSRRELAAASRAFQADADVYARGSVAPADPA